LVDSTQDRIFGETRDMAQPAETYGTVATQLLLDRLGGRVRERRRIVVLPPDFIVRISSGAQASAPA
jgi:DNA-binding LacI/PurR family transcriptional regulator